MLSWVEYEKSFIASEPEGSVLTTMVLFHSTVAGVVQCGGRKKSPRTSS